MSFYLKKYMWLISLLAVVFCSYFLAKITANFIALQFEGGYTPPTIALPQISVGTGERKEIPEGTYEPIVDRNVFDSKFVKSDPAAQASTSPDPVVAPDPLDPNAEAVLTTLGIKLVSTFSVGAGTDKRSTAIISSAGGGKGGEDVYTIEDEKQFAPDTKIVKILYNRVEFVNKSRLEYVELDDFAAQGGAAISRNKPEEPGVDDKEPKVAIAEEPKIQQSAEGKFVIDRAEIEAALANLDKLYTQIRAVPHFKEGRPNGLKLLSVRGDSIFSKLGLRRGDILQKINGMELDIKKGLEIFSKLKTENSVTMDIERRGTAQSLEYEIR